MEGLPADILAAVPDDARPAVQRWWSGLTDADRREAAGAWDLKRTIEIATHQQRQGVIRNEAGDDARPGPSRFIV